MTETNIKYALVAYNGSKVEDAYVFKTYADADAYIIKNHNNFLSWVTEYMDDDVTHDANDYDKVIAKAKMESADGNGFETFCEWYNVTECEDGPRIVECDDYFWASVADGEYVLQLP
jgi:hypothetical protein|nr:MAG TPA: hypothetical protein [Caudoviricetes sp.]